jgi:NTE family protein
MDNLVMARNNGIENVLILQGCGSLGAFGCGVFKAIAESGVTIDILAGTSIGGNKCRNYRRQQGEAA